MHRLNTQRWPQLMAASLILAVLFGGLISQTSRAVSANPSPVCVGTSCSITFAYSGDYYLWSPPTSARSFSFDIQGAQGGRSGGLGGRVTGTLVNNPTSLYIYVGGAGNTGNYAAGGFNGGGTAGSGHTDEGSGGGASDIRTSTLLADRIAVAGGGGGSGGYFGSAGGNAGGTVGTAGTNGQGAGGGGGTQTAGGNGGYPNGGSWGIGGDIGVGGAGGASTFAGGGGGGGGYYGGGGGGADLDSCCTNGGGGGGGSSWTSTTATASVTNTGGYRSGAGTVVISYVLPPSASTFAPTTTLTNANAISYSLIFNESVTGLANTDFATTGSTATYSSISVTGSGTTYTVTLSGCSSGTLKLKLLANSVQGTIAGPTADQTTTDVVIDQVVPTVSVTLPSSPTNATQMVYRFDFSKTVTGLDVTDFAITGTACRIDLLSGSASSYSVTVGGCSDGATAQLTLSANSVVDAAGNLGPAISPTIAAITIDRSAPVPTWASAVASTYVSPTFAVSFSEVVDGVTASDFTQLGTATGCTITISETVLRRNFSLITSGCGLGTVQLQMASNSYTDYLGNQGPATASAPGVTTIASVPAPAPTPTPTPTPTASATPTASPSATPTPVVSGGSSGGSGGSSSSGGTSNPAPTSPLVAPVTGVEPIPLIEAQPIRKTYVLNPIPLSTFTAPKSPDIKSQSSEPAINFAVKKVSETKPQLKAIEWQPIAGFALGGLSVMFATIGTVKWVRQTRTRRLIKKFA